MTLSEFRDDLERACDSIEKSGGGRLTCHRAAEWSIRRPEDPRLAVLADAKFVSDGSVTPVPPLGAPENPAGPYRLEWEEAAIFEVPPLTGRGFGRTLPVGGAWPFRMFSSARIRRAEDAFRDAGWPAVFTFHPWELDSDHPPMEGLPAISKLVHFYNLASLPERFERWLAQDRAVALGEACRGLVVAAV
jgi:hypothetical protein